ncbi:MFS transporter [Smaragdicoccus niigatensis]
MHALMRSRWIDHWNAEDVEAWEAGGKNVARRNLIASIFAEHIGFSVWSIWSVMVLFMPEEVYGIDPGGKFILMAVPIACGAMLRIPYSIAPAKFGGRNFTIFSALLLFIPAVLTTYFMLHPASYPTYLVVAAVAGVGGGNFASSMANINLFYPQRLKGLALGLNAGGGNLGVTVIQLLSLLVIATVGNRRPEIVCAIYLVLIAAAAVCAAVMMDNISGQHASLKRMLEALRFRHSWILSLLYIGTFGSFIGFSFAFGQIMQINYKAAGETAAQAALHAAQIAWLGPLLGALFRPIGGKFADRMGGGRVTFSVFIAMMGAGGLLAYTSHADDLQPGAATHGQMTTYIVGFLILFMLAGIGNGSTYKMIPVVFEAKSHDLEGLSVAERAAWSRSTAGALLGFAGAIGSLGGVLINMTLRQSYTGPAHSGTHAFYVFLTFYVICAVVTWWFFVRRSDPQPVGVVHRTPFGAKLAVAGGF